MYELPGRAPDDSAALGIARDHSKAMSEISVDSDGNYRQKMDDTLESMVKALALERVLDMGIYRILRISVTKAIQQGLLLFLLSYTLAVFTSNASSKGVLSVALAHARIGSSALASQIETLSREIVDAPPTTLVEDIHNQWVKEKKIWDTLKLSLYDNDKVANKDYGPNDELYALVGQCFRTTDTRSFEYTVCPFEQV